MSGEDNKIFGFSKERQPKNRRKSVKFLTDMLTKELRSAKKEITITGIDIKTGKKSTISISQPTKDTIVHALLKEAANGNMIAIREIFDRTEGKAPQFIEIDADVTRETPKEQDLSILTDDELRTMAAIQRKLDNGNRLKACG